MTNLRRRSVIRYFRPVEPRAAQAASVWAGHMTEARRRCRSDLYFLCQRVLGFDDLAPLHADLCGFLDRTRVCSDRLVLMPRGHFKSSIVTVGGAIQAMICALGGSDDPRAPVAPQRPYSIGIGSWDQRTARHLLGQIRGHLERNDMLRILFPEIFFDDPARESPMWTRDAMCMRTESLSGDGAQPTLVAFSCESPPTGFHFDRLIVDDMVTHENVATADLISKTAQRMADLEFLRKNPDSPMDVVGTRHHWADLYGRLLERPHVRSYVRAAVEDGRPAFPERFSLAALNRQRQQDRYSFECQMMQSPRSRSRIAYNARELPRYDAPPPRGRMRIVAMLDPAVSTKPGADYSAAVVIGFDDAGCGYLLDGFRDRLGPTELGAGYARLLRQWRPDIALCEEVGFQAYVLEAVRAAGWSSLHGIRARGRKQDRIARIFPLIDRTMFRLPRAALWKSAADGHSYDLAAAWVHELVDFPQGEHDDLLDATAAALAWRGQGLAFGEDVSPAGGPTAPRPAWQTGMEDFTEDSQDEEAESPSLDAMLGDYA